MTDPKTRRRGRPSAGEIEARACLAEANDRVQVLEGMLADRTRERDQAIDAVSEVRSELREIENSTREQIASFRGELEAASKRPAETPRAYYLQRSDLTSLGRGKGLAQAMHAGNAMTSALVVEPLLQGVSPDDDVMAWHREGKGFGTAIALGNGEVTAPVIAGILRMAGACGLRAGDIVDDTYPYKVDAEIVHLIDDDVHTAPPRRTKDGYMCFRREVTGLWLFGLQHELDPLLARFALTADA